MKIGGGTIGTLDESSLLNASVAGPIIRDILQRLEKNNLREDYLLYHENTDADEKIFMKDKKSLINAFIKFVNPFTEEESLLVHVVCKHIVDEKATQQEVFSNKKFQSYVNERLLIAARLFTTTSKEIILLFFDTKIHW